MTLPALYARQASLLRRLKARRSPGKITRMQAELLAVTCDILRAELGRVG